jgi:hypothetical protein
MCQETRSEGGVLLARGAKTGEVPREGIWATPSFTDAVKAICRGATPEAGAWLTEISVLYSLTCRQEKVSLALISEQSVNISEFGYQ